MKRDALGTYLLKELDSYRAMPGKNAALSSILFCLFKEVGEGNLNLLLENSIMDDYDGKTGEYMGAVFQKTFRQTDVTKSGHVDMAIWHCIGASKDFWEVMTDIFDWLDAKKSKETP